MTTAYTELVAKQRAHFLTGATTDLAGRRKRLETFKKLLEENKKAIDDAIFADLHRTNMSDVDFTIAETDHVLKHFEEWSQPISKPTPVGEKDFSDSDHLLLVPEPLGVILIIGPWNFPLITIAPLVAAIAAGNTVIVKPSELDPTFSATFARLVKKYFDEKEFAVVEGGIPETTDLLKERFDHILYTGCPPVAKIIMAAAAKHLTPVTLELGGKNPVFVDDTADLARVCKGVATAKLLNAGQICISADYIITTPEVKPQVVAALTQTFETFGDMAKVPDFARIVNERHFQRLMALLEKTKGKVAYKAGGEISAKDKFIPFHLIDVEHSDEFMKEEIFGPLLPLITVPSFDAALEYIRVNEKPLAAYIFTTDETKAKRFIRETSSGGVTVNDTFTHAFAPGMPFGGVGNSGIGRLNGKYSFDNFSHEKPVCLRAGVRPCLKL